MGKLFFWSSLISDDPTSCVLYAVHDEGKKHSQFFTVDPANEFEVKLLGPIYRKHDIEALDIQPTTNQIFATAGDDGVQPGHLYKVNSWTGHITLVGDTGFKEINGLSFTPAGILWGWAEGDGLIQIDTQTGRATLEIPYDGPIEDITWDNEGIILYGVENNTLLAYDSQANLVIALNCTLPADNEVESLEMLPDDRLLFSIHNDETLNIHAIDIESCEMLSMEIPVALDEIKLNDVEGIAWPVDACIR